MAAAKFLAVLRALGDSGVDFIVVGGLSAVFNGAPINTLDVDVVHSREPANLDRLLRVLEDLDAIYRIQAGRKLRPNASYLAAAGHQNLTTKYGPVDFLGTIGRGLGYDELLPHSLEMEVGAGVRSHVLRIETLIAIKEELGGEKDRAVLPILRRTLEEKIKTGYTPQQ